MKKVKFDIFFMNFIETSLKQPLLGYLRDVYIGVFTMP